MKNDKFLIELIGHLSNRPTLFFLGWGVLVIFFLYLFWGLKKERNRRYFREEDYKINKTGNTIQTVETKNDVETTSKKD